MDLAGKVVIVTGGAAGIGRALCLKFAEAGAGAVIVAYVDEAGAKEVAAGIKGQGALCDVRREEDLIRVIRMTELRYGRVDLFCSNAGILILGGLEVDNDAWRMIWEINVLSHIYAARAVIPGMIARGGGAFLVTASAAGLLSQIGSLPYSVTKHAAIGFAENLSITYGDRGILVFALCPQAVETEMTRQGGGAAAVDGIMKPEKVAEAVIAAFETEEFLILPHPEVKTYLRRKTDDYSRWLRGMSRLQERLGPGPG